MSFLKSAINQVGRDLGKVVSNQIFKDAHSKPIRIVRSGDSGSGSAPKGRVVKSEFEKSISFQLSFRPNTLVSKMAAAYFDLKNEVESFYHNGFLSMEELHQLVMLFNTYNKKARNINELLELDEDKNMGEIEKLAVLVDKNKGLFIETIEFGINAIQESLNDLENQKVEEQKGLSGLFKNSKIKKQNNSVESSISDLISYKETLTDLLKQVKR